MSVILSDLKARLEAMTGAPATLVGVNRLWFGDHRDAAGFDAAVGAAPELMALAQAALAWRTTMNDSPDSEVAKADLDALLDALSKVHP